MAFKTDTIKLKLHTGSDPTADNGELAIVDNVLRLRTGNSWANVSGSSVSQLSDLSDVDDPSSSAVNEVAYLYDDGLGNRKLGFQKLTVDNLSSTNFLSVSDLSDTNTPATLTASEENKVLGVISYPSVTSSLTFDFSGLPDPIIALTSDSIIFTIEGQLFSIYLEPNLGGSPSGTVFTERSSADWFVDLAVDGISPTDLRNDIYTVLDNYFSADGWILSQGTNTLTLTAPSVNAQYDISSLSGPNTLAVVASTVAAINGGYQYELVDPIQGVLVDGDFGSAGLMTTDGAGAYTITTNNSTNWDTAFGWGDHSTAGYLTSETSHADVVVDGDFTSQGLMKRGASAGSYSIVSDNSANWDTAFGWGNHATYGYLTSTDTQNLNVVNSTIPTSDVFLFVNSRVNDFVYCNTANFSGYSLRLSDADLYGSQARITIINASTYDLPIAKIGTGSWTYSIPQLGLSAQTSFTLEAYQKALILNTGTALTWQVIILPA